MQRTLRSRHNLRAKDDNKPLVKKQSQSSADVNKSIKSTPI